MAPITNGRVMKGPIPTISIIFIEVACIRFRPRTKGGPLEDELPDIISAGKVRSKMASAK
jgi:hypothetical protein